MRGRGYSWAATNAERGVRPAFPGLLTRPSSATAGLPVPDRRRVTWKPPVGRTAGSRDHCREHLRDREESLGKPGNLSV